jgi:hypothetical protein
MIESEADVGPCHGEAPHHVEARRVLASRRAQELAPRGDLGEQVLDPHARPRGQRGWPFGCERAVIDRPRPALVCRPHTAFERQPRHAGDRRQRLAAKAERDDLLDCPAFSNQRFGQLRGRMPLQGERDVAGRHTAAVVGHLDPGEPAVHDPYLDPRRSGVDRVLDQFLERRGRPLDHFACSNTVDERLGQAANVGHASTVAPKRLQFEPIGAKPYACRHKFLAIARASR